MKKDYGVIAENIINEVGGKENINGVTHCMTRLRFTLKDHSIPKDEVVKALDGVLSIVRQGGQYQVVIGTDVDLTYEEVAKRIGYKDDSKNIIQEKIGIKNVAYYGNLILDYISGSIAPALPVLIGSGMILAILSILSMLGLMNPEGSNYIVLYQIANAGFYYLPIFIGYNAAKKLKIEPFAGAFLGGILLIPTIMGVEGLSLFGKVLSPADYSSSVFPILLTVAILKIIDLGVNKILPNTMKVMLKMAIDIAVTAPLMLLFIAPLGTILSSYITSGLEVANSFSPILGTGLLALLLPGLISTGMHTALLPVSISLVAETGFDPFLMPAAIGSNFAIVGATFAVALKTKNKTTKIGAMSAGVTSVVAVAEPALFGVLIRLKKPFISASIASGIMGCVIGLLKIKAVATVPVGIATLPIYFNDGLFSVVATTGSAFGTVILSFIITWLLGFDLNE